MWIWKKFLYEFQAILKQKAYQYAKSAGEKYQLLCYYPRPEKTFMWARAELQLAWANFLIALAEAIIKPPKNNT